jgi:KAP family P-loop domain
VDDIAQAATEDRIGLRVPAGRALPELGGMVRRGEELLAASVTEESELIRFRREVRRWTTQAGKLLSSLYERTSPAVEGWSGLPQRESPADDIAATIETTRDELAERIDFLGGLIVDLRLHDEAPAESDGVGLEQRPSSIAALLRDHPPPHEVEELLERATAIADARGEPTMVIDIVLAAIERGVRPDRSIDPRAASLALARAIAEPRSDRFGAAMRVHGIAEVSALQPEELPVDSPAFERVLLGAYAVMNEVGSTNLWSHHVVGWALAELDLTAEMVDALGCDADALRTALRQGIAERWPREDAAAWDRWLAPHGTEQRETLQLDDVAAAAMANAVAVSRSLGRTITVEGDVLLGVLTLQPPFEGLATALLDPGGSGIAGERISSAHATLGWPYEPTNPEAVASDEFEAMPVVRRAVDFARATSGTSTVTLPCLLAATVGHVGRDVLDSLQLDAETLRARTLAWITSVEPSERAAAWNALLSAPDVELSAVFATDRVPAVRLDATAAPLVDHLGVGVYVTMLATLIARRSTPMPVSIGLFGEWGSGKSYFMELVRQEVARLAQGARGDDDSPYYSDVLQMTFNAWHYADTNLWASLAFEFFEQLGGTDGVDPSEARRAEVQLELSKAQQLRKDLEESKAQATSHTADLREQLATATTQRERRAKQFEGQVLAAVARNPQIQQQIGELAGSVGLDKNDGVAVLQFARDIAGTRDDIAATRRVLSRSRLRWAFLLLLVAIGCVGLALALPDEWLRWFRGGAVVATFAFVADVGRLVGRSRRTVGELRKLAETSAAIEGEVLDGGSLKELEGRLREAEAKEVLAEARLDEVVGLIAELDRQLVELSPGRNLYRFLAERSARYQSQLGVVSVLRRDFEQLVALMTAWKLAWADEATRKEEHRPIDRIVLYIDDLDRCEPEQVVTVLQAVHLLLAMDLFVVVVGVDPRWLLRSLRRRYRRILGAASKDDRDAGFRESTPQNYLEKIFQVPFVLPSMDATGFGELLGHLTQPVSPSTPARTATPRASATPAHATAGTEPAEATPTVQAASVPPPTRPADITAQARSEVATVRRGESRPAATPITDDELALLARLSSLVRTPREATRLVNVYGMLRSTRDLTERGSFLDRSGQPGHYQAVVQLLGILTGFPELLGALLWGRNASGEVEQRALCRAEPARSWKVFIEGLEPRQDGGAWCNDIADALTRDEVDEWRRLREALDRVRAHTTLDDIEPFRVWGPLVARFSFLLSAFANDEPDVVVSAPASAGAGHIGGAS